MQITRKSFDNTDEKYTRVIFDNGFTCYIIPKDVVSAYAAIGVHFGSCDTVCAGTNEEFPVGTAHFLEHKMFQTKKGDAFELFANLGAGANAYTANDKTVYNFTCTENFYENYGILLDMIFNAHYTKKSVEKEKGIIAQEIMMYADNPRWRCHMNMLELMYGKCALSADPCGSVEYIRTVTPELLDKCRKIAYTPDRMVACVCGCVDEVRIIEQTEKALRSVKRSKGGTFLLPNITSGPVKARYAEYGDVASPIFNMGIRLDSGKTSAEIKEFAAVEIIMNLLFGKSSDLYSELYEKGLFEAIGDGCQTERNAFYANVSGVSMAPDGFKESVCAKIKEYTEKGFEKTDFERTKKAIYGDLIFSYESPESVADSVISFHMENDDFFEYPAAIASVDKEFAENFFRERFLPENICISIIFPKEDQK
ncbi:MAG: insulinase family protein [Clostridia bacterium]|nr:insulinase family protein [Clostridia bacterium]